MNTKSLDALKESAESIALFVVMNSMTTYSLNHVHQSLLEAYEMGLNDGLGMCSAEVPNGPSGAPSTVAFVEQSVLPALASDMPDQLQVSN